MEPDETTTVGAVVDGVRQLQLETTSIVGDVADLSAKLRALHLEEVRQRDTFADPADFFLQPRWKRNAASGDVMVESLLTFLARYDRTDFKRSKEQREMHVLWTMASLRQIYAHEYAAKMPALLRRFKVKSFSPYVAMFAMRRFGKTVAMAMWVAGFLWTQRKSVINVFSISQRTSIAMKNKIVAMLEKIVGRERDIVKKVNNAEQLTIVNALGEESTVYSYPCSEKLRGMGSDTDEHNNINLLEEAAFVDEKILKKIVLPLMKMKNAVFLTISTLGGMFDPWKEMTDAKDERGRPVFLVKTYSIVCDDCIEKGIPEKCLHKRDLLPHWQSAEDDNRVKALMGSSRDDWLREGMGVMGTGDFIPAFNKQGLAFLALAEKHLAPATSRRACVMESSVERIRKHSAWVYAKAPRPGASRAAIPPPLPEPRSPVVDGLANPAYPYCFIAIDPAAGGRLSNYAIISMVWDIDGVVVIVGLEDFPTPKTLPASHRVLNHIDALRSQFPQLLRTKFVIAPECNMGNDANELAYLVMRHRDKPPNLHERRPDHRDKIIVLNEGGSQYGIRTGDRRNPLASKESMRKSAAAIVNAKKLRFLHNFVCVCDPEEQRQDVLAARLIKQLKVYGAEILPPTQQGERSRRRWHGKHGGQHDDLAMAFQLCLVANQMFFAQPGKYGI